MLATLDQTIAIDTRGNSDNDEGGEDGELTAQTLKQAGDA